MENYKYKPSKTLDEMIEHLSVNKRVTYNQISKDDAKEVLYRFNYINVITPFKHRFADKGGDGEVIKVNNRHVYSRDVDFLEYCQCYIDEKTSYPTIIRNILDFEAHFKSILSYHVFNSVKINNSNDLRCFLNKCKANIEFLSYGDLRKNHMKKQIKSIKNDIDKYPNLFCFFDRMSLGTLLTVYSLLENNLQEEILNGMKKYNMNLGVDQVPHFINNTFTLVGIRNCVMHNNSLEILIRFSNLKTKELRSKTVRNKYIRIINILSR